MKTPKRQRPTPVVRVRTQLRAGVKTATPHPAACELSDLKLTIS